MYVKRESRGSGDENSSDSVSERDSVFEEEDEGDDEEEDVSALSSLENYQLCLKYQQVPHQKGSVELPPPQEKKIVIP